MIDTPSITSDHALLLACIVAGKARWEPFYSMTDHGEVCINGLRWMTRVDEYGCPIISENLRAELMKAKQQRLLEKRKRD